MYVGRRVSYLVLSTLFIGLAGCTGSSPEATQGADNSGRPPASDDRSLASVEDQGPVSVVNTSCFYAPLPGAFRIYCPGPQRADASCLSVPAETKVNFEISAEGSTQTQTVSARTFTASEKAALPSLCVAFDLNLLPNSNHKLSYLIGRKEYHVYSYLTFGDGSIP
jgi:hypothetical protein